MSDRQTDMQTDRQTDRQTHSLQLKGELLQKHIYNSKNKNLQKLTKNSMLAHVVQSETFWVESYVTFPASVGASLIAQLAHIHDICLDYPVVL